MSLVFGKICEMAQVQGLTFIVVVCSVLCYFDGVDLMKNFIHILLVVSGVFVLGYIYGRIWRKMFVI